MKILQFRQNIETIKNTKNSQIGFNLPCHKNSEIKKDTFERNLPNKNVSFAGHFRPSEFVNYSKNLFYRLTGKEHPQKIWGLVGEEEIKSFWKRVNPKENPNPTKMNCIRKILDFPGVSQAFFRDTPTFSYRFVKDIYDFSTLSAGKLQLAQKFMQKTAQAVKKGEIPCSKAMLKEVFDMVSALRNEEDIDCAFKLLYAKKDIFFDAEAVTNLVKRTHSRGERNLLIQYAKDRGNVEYFDECIRNLSLEFEGFYKKNNRPMNDKEINILSSYITALEYRTQKESATYNGDFIHLLIPLTTKGNQKDIERLLKSPFALTDIPKILKYKKENPDIAQQIIPYAAKKGKNELAFSSVKEYFEFQKKSGESPALELISANPSLKTSEVKKVYELLKDDAQISTILSDNLKTSTLGHLEFLISHLKKYPVLKEELALNSTVAQRLNKYIKTKATQKTHSFNHIEHSYNGQNDKITTLHNIFREDNYSDWKKIIPLNASKEDAQKYIDVLYEMLATRQRLDSQHYPQWSSWAIKSKNIVDCITQDIKSGDSFDEVFENIAIAYKSMFKRTDNTTLIRDISLITPYGKNGYKEYTERFEKLFNKARPSEFKDITLTTISPSFIGTEIRHVMHHADATSIKPALEKASQHYDIIRELVNKKQAGQKLSAQDIKKAHKNIATICYLLYNVVPFERGSAGTTTLLMRSMYKALGINCPPTKHNVALDLESFCNSYPEYLEKWQTFFESQIK